MKHNVVFCILLFLPAYCFSQEVFSEDSLRLNSIINGNAKIDTRILNEIENAFDFGIKRKSISEGIYPKPLQIIKPKINQSPFHLNKSSRFSPTIPAIDYKLNKNLWLNADRVNNANSYNNPLLPNSIYRDEFGVSLSVKISSRLTFKTGCRYVYNQVTKRWELIYLNTLSYDF